MRCARCDSDLDVVSVDTVILSGHVAELFECRKCRGIIEVFYEKDAVTKRDIKSYRFERYEKLNKT